MTKQKKSSGVSILLAMTLGSILILQGCGKPSGLGSSDTTLAATQSADFNTISRNILQPKCVPCHSDASPSSGLSFSSYTSLMASGAVVANSPNQSPLFTSINSGLMPKGGTKLSSAEIDSISNWISAGALPAPVTPNPAPTPSPTAAPTVTATFSSINSTILQARCISCHSGSSPSGGIDLSSYTKVLTAAVTAGNPSTSKLYTATSGGAMPPSGSKLNATELGAISDWITAGAANN